VCPIAGGHATGDIFAPGLVARAREINNAATTLTRKSPGLLEGRDHDDVVAILSEVAWDIWRSSGGSWPEDWARRMYLLGRSAVRNWADHSAATGGVSGVSQARRQWRSEMANADPAQAEPSQATSPAVVASKAPLAIDGLSQSVLVAPGVEDQVVEATTTEALLEALSAAADASSPRIGRFARAWLTSIAMGEAPSIAEIAQSTGTSRSSATRYAAAVRLVALEVLADAVAS